MQIVRIRIPDREQCVRAFGALIRWGRVDCYRDNTFVIPELGLQLLQEMGISFVELGRGAWFNFFSNKEAGHGCTAEQDKR